MSIAPSSTTATVPSVPISIASSPVPSPARIIAMEPYESISSSSVPSTPNGTKRASLVSATNVGSTAGDVKLFRHQVGGRCPLLSSATYIGTIMKPTVKREQDFYDNMERDIPSLIPFVPTYHGTIQMAATLFPAAMSEEPAPNSEGCAEWGRHEGSVERMNIMIAKSPLVNALVLEDLSFGYYRPSILDLKIGTRQHGPGAPPIKIASKTMKCTSTTSATLGLRMCGMQVFRPKLDRYVVKDKFYGRKLDTTTFPGMMREYFEDGSGRVRTELLGPLLARLRAFREVMCQQTQFRFYSCSLFLIHEGAFTAGNNVPLPQLPLPSPLHKDNKESKTTTTTDSAAAPAIRLPTNEEIKPSGVPSMSSPSVDPRLRCDLRLLDFAQTGRPSEEGGDDNTDLDHGLLLGVDSLIRILTSLLNESPATDEPSPVILPTPVASLPSTSPPVAAVSVPPVAVPGPAFPPTHHTRRTPSSSHLHLSTSAPSLPASAASSTMGLSVNTHSASTSSLSSLVQSTPSSGSGRHGLQTESPTSVGTGHSRRESASSSSSVPSPLPQTSTTVRRGGSSGGSNTSGLARVPSTNNMNNGASPSPLIRIGSSNNNGSSSSSSSHNTSGHGSSLIHNEMPAVSVS